MSLIQAVSVSFLEAADYLPEDRSWVANYDDFGVGEVLGRQVSVYETQENLTITFSELVATVQHEETWKRLPFSVFDYVGEPCALTRVIWATDMAWWGQQLKLNPTDIFI